MGGIKNNRRKYNIIKTLLNFPRLLRNPVYFFQKTLNDNEGLMEFRLPYNFVLTDRPELIRHIFQKNHRNYIKTKIVRNDLRQAMGNGLLTSNGEYWLKQRRVIQKGFHRKRLEGISKIMITEIKDYMDTVMDDLAEKEAEIDLTKEMAHLAFRVVSKGLFGEEVDEEKLKLIDRVITEVQQFIINRLRKPFLKPWYYISGANYRNQKLIDQGNEMILEVIRERKASEGEFDDLLQMLIESRYEDGEGMTEQQILEEALILMVAGHETSAMSLSWTWMLLAQNPDTEKKLLHTVEETLGEEAPTFEKLRELGYTLQVVEESMRLYPPAWIVDREPLEKDEFEGVEIKKGVDIAALIYGLHRNEKYWEYPDKFDPERFNEANKKTQTPYSYLPFGGGPRLCIGNNFALMEMQYILAMFVRRYRFELIKKQEIEILPMITLRAKNGIKVKVKRR